MQWNESVLGTSMEKKQMRMIFRERIPGVSALSPQQLEMEYWRRGKGYGEKGSE